MFRSIFCPYDEEWNEIENLDSTPQGELQTPLTISTVDQASGQSTVDPNLQQTGTSADFPAFCEFLQSEETENSVKDISRSTLGSIHEEFEEFPIFHDYSFDDVLIYLTELHGPVQNNIVAESEKVVSPAIYLSTSSSGTGLDEEGGEKIARNSSRSLFAISHSDTSPADGDRESAHLQLPHSSEAPNHIVLHRSEEAQKSGLTYSIAIDGADANRVVTGPVGIRPFGDGSFEFPVDYHLLGGVGTTQRPCPSVPDGRSSNSVGVNLPSASCESPAYLQQSATNGETQESFLPNGDSHDHSNAGSTTAIWEPQSERIRRKEALYRLEELLSIGHHADAEASEYECGWTDEQREQILESILKNLEDITGAKSDPQNASCSTPSNEDDLKSLIVDHPLFSHIIMASLDCYKLGADEEEEKVLDDLANLHFPQLDAPGPEKNLEGRRSSQGRDPRLDLGLEQYLQLLREFKSDVEKVVASAATFCEQMKQNVLIQCPELGDSLGPKQSESGSVSGSLDEYLSSKELEEMILSDYAQANDSATSLHSIRAQMLSDEEWRGAILATYDPNVLRNLQRKHLREGRKNAKLPEPARRVLMDWWREHFGNPYPIENEKLDLAKETGLQIDQINNWFINQRKRHCCAVFSENHKSHSPDCYKVTAPRR